MDTRFTLPYIIHVYGMMCNNFGIAVFCAIDFGECSIYIGEIELAL